jgi:hypothetical protein
MWHAQHVYVIHVSKVRIPERKRVSVHAYECHVSHYQRPSVVRATCFLREYKSCGTHQVQQDNKSRVSDVYMSHAG